MNGSSLTSEAGAARSEAGSIAAALVRRVVQLHRWLGVAMCLLFAMWFSTGTVMLFVPYPDLSGPARFRSMAPIRFDLIRVAPAQVAAGDRRLGALGVIEGGTGPSYLLVDESGPARLVDATDGQSEPMLSAKQALVAAGRFCACRPNEVRGPYDYDEWTVQQRFDRDRPLFRVSLGDAASTQLYVSARTGEVLQRTTGRERLFNYVGSVLHWIYPTILRRYPVVWSWTVWAISLVGITTGAAGLTIGMLRTRKSLANVRKSRISPFKNLLRWHHLLGLTAGSFLLSWIVSGWLSVDHGLLFPTGDPSSSEVQAFRGLQLRQAAAEILPATLHRLRNVVAVNVDAVGGEVFLSGRQAGTGVPLTWTSAGSKLTRIPDGAILAGVREAWPGTRPRMTEIASSDDYGHLLYEPIAGDSVRVHLGDAAGTWVHVNGADGRIEEIMDWRRRLYRWLFNGLHTFDVPGLERHDLLRKIVMLPLLAAGFTLSVTGVILGVRRVRRTLASH